MNPHTTRLRKGLGASFVIVGVLFILASNFNVSRLTHSYVGIACFVLLLAGFVYCALKQTGPRQ
ncbi:hypothetical protein [Salinimonas sediminis]|uniref:Uncharacterized protein n=1 Tax=Salinimonas sediminis TaxID=2303538 RepID=A0A346NPI3_9ALTE|nr:hypothetical protein [Salinimonas sediminis]AXR07440.1 hypothetical protein D0Y50_14420 [Salinimonas sediminis]